MFKYQNSNFTVIYNNIILCVAIINMLVDYFNIEGGEV
jgi:hypothetical protein